MLQVVPGATPHWGPGATSIHPSSPLSISPHCSAPQPTPEHRLGQPSGGATSTGARSLMGEQPRRTVARQATVAAPAWKEVSQAW